MEYKQIQELIKTINKSSISELSIEDGDFKITIKQEFSSGAAQYPMQAMQPMQHMMSAQPMSQVHGAAAAGEEKATPKAETPSATGITVKSPMIGTFYRSPSPDKPVFINVGDEIKAGQIVCIIEAMKLFNEIESEVSGRVIKVLADDSSPVEYDQPLFLVEPI
ncbi:MAG: acetyl-CoA carboxylase biotin carboxyl carrier protein [Taibaiella sp.]|nr:acetyl-CoA carboxylase biotin carboxyl carrier protein [Taibaiella sp.]